MLTWTWYWVDAPGLPFSEASQVRGEAHVDVVEQAKSGAAVMTGTVGALPAAGVPGSATEPVVQGVFVFHCCLASLFSWQVKVLLSESRALSPRRAE